MRPVVAIACGGYSGEFEIYVLGRQSIDAHSTVIALTR